jgi:hypothetical protein
VAWEDELMRMIHTADWQIGKVFKQFGDKEESLRQARLTAIENIGRLAVQETAGHVLVAGDVFDNEVPTEVTLRAFAGDFEDYLSTAARGQAKRPRYWESLILSRSGWARKFKVPIPLPKGKPLATLRDAALYITKLPHDTEEWQAAMEALLLVAEHGGPTMFARIGVMRALNRASPVSPDVPRTESPFQKRATSFHGEQMGYPEKRDDPSLKRKRIGDGGSWRGIDEERSERPASTKHFLMTF